MSQEDAANSFGKQAVMVALRGVFSTAIPPFPIDDASNRFKRLRLALGLSIVSDIPFANRYSLTGPRTANLVRYCIYSASTSKNAVSS